MIIDPIRGLAVLITVAILALGLYAMVRTSGWRVTLYSLATTAIVVAACLVLTGAIGIALTGSLP